VTVQASATDRDVLVEYAAERRRESRLPRAEPARPGDVVISEKRSFWRRLSVTDASHRLPRGSYETAASAGLQDSAPRSGQLSLHARVDDVHPEAWCDPTLMQIWFRWADYIIAKRDHGIFTRGAMPRHHAAAVALERLADEIASALSAGASSTDIRRKFDPLVRATSATGRIAITWDARTVEVGSAPRPLIDDEEARVLLANRFLHWYGPATPFQFAKWAGVSRADATTTWRQLDSITSVSLAGVCRWVHQTDLERLEDASRPIGVRLLPQGDPALYLDAPPVPRVPPVTASLSSRMGNSLTGRVVVDGEIVGAWGRRGGTVALFPWTDLADRAGDVEDEASAVARAVGRRPRVLWITG
jgi:hypothetical protein